MTAAPAPTGRPATATERQFWFAERIAPGSPAWRVLSAVRIDGAVDRTLLTEAAGQVVARHPALHSVFTPAGGDLWCAPVAPVAPPLTDLPPGAGFDSAAGLLARTALLDIAAGHHVVLGLSPDAADASGATLYVLTHHLVHDGLSHEVFTADLAAAYARAAAADDAPEPAPPPPAPPRPLDPGAEAELTAYWRTALAGVPDLPGADDGPTQRDLAEADPVGHPVTFPDGAAPAVRAAGRALACPPIAVLLSAYAQALHDLSGADDFCIGTPVSSRTPDQADTIGCLLTTLPVRVRRLAEPGACVRIWEAFADGLLHMDLPQDRLIGAVRGRPGRRLPLYQALFAYESWPRPVHDAGPLRLRTEPVVPLGAQAEIQFQLGELPGDRLAGVLQAPAGGLWAERLPALAAAVRRRLAELTAVAISTSTSATNDRGSR
ncbi:condensation domain-containing protein [Streptomyces sp. NPDC001980]|uniref:condensation domain-containing protein n=1 Tax=Streptomyces sp. NPDC001980 TaxID=3157126 RepID=UPI00331DBDE2